SYYEDVTATVSPDFTMAPEEGIEAPASIDVTFNQDVDPTSVVIKVTGADGAEVAGKVEQSTTDPKMFSFKPDAALKAGDYTLSVSGAKGVAAGNVMTEMSQTFKVKEAAKAAKIKVKEAAKAAKKGKK
ncbi:MAG: Ig-like domain-containing protein, partial [Candidatus Poribacteria bacterium]